jgi:hypothetical protein
VFAFIIAFQQLGVATALINTLVTGAVAALALAAGLAFGLGGRPLAESMLENWYGRAQAAEPKAERAARSARRQAGGEEG